MSWLFFLRFAPEVLVSSTEAKKRWKGSGRGRWLRTDSLSVSELVHQIQSLDTLCSGERGCVVEREVPLVQRCGSLAGSGVLAPAPKAKILMLREPSPD